MPGNSHSIRRLVRICALLLDSSFRFYKNTAGKTAYAQIGRSCEITLAEARQKAKDLKAEIQLGADPQAEAR